MKKFINDPIHGEIPIHDEVLFIDALLKTREVRRLQRILQLGECFNVFSTATHTRYSHSIGVFYNACRFVDGLGVKIPINDYKAILAAALLHDVGHGPRSHCFEMYANHHHEDMTIRIISDEKTEVNQILNQYGIDIEQVILIIKKKHPIKYYWQIVSSQIDADRLDYLMRDSYFIGANFGTTDAGVVFQWSSVINNEIVFDVKAINLLEDILFSRLQMFRQIYTNHKVVCYEHLLAKIFVRYKVLVKQNFKFINKYNLYSLLDSYVNDVPWNIDDFQLLDENSLNLIIESWKQEKDEELQTLCLAYLQHNNYECVTLEHLQKNKYEKFEEVKSSIQLYDPAEEILVKDENIVKPINHYNNVLSDKHYKWTSTLYFIKK